MFFYQCGNKCSCPNFFSKISFFNILIIQYETVHRGNRNTISQNTPTHPRFKPSSNLSAHSILNCFLTKCLYYPCLIISYGPTSPLSILHQRVFGITFPTNLSSCKISFYSQKETKNKCNFHSVSVGVINCLLGTSRKLFSPLCHLF